MSKAAAALKLAVVVAGKGSPPAAGTARLKTALDAQGQILFDIWDKQPAGLRGLEAKEESIDTRGKCMPGGC